MFAAGIFYPEIKAETVKREKEKSSDDKFFVNAGYCSPCLFMVKYCCILGGKSNEKDRIYR